MSRRIALALAVAALSAGCVTALAVAATHFSSHGNAGQEVQTPAVDSNAQSQTSFKLSDDGLSLSYRLNVAGLDGVRFAHIHLGARGQNGPVVAFLLDPQVPSTGRIQGTIATGTITAADLVGPLAGQPLSALVDAIESGGAYTNVHTDTYPGGEVRGQIR